MGKKNPWLVLCLGAILGASVMLLLTQDSSAPLLDAATRSTRPTSSSLNESIVDLPSAKTPSDRSLEDRERAVTTATDQASTEAPIKEVVPIAFDHPLIIRNIRDRQEALRWYASWLTGDAPLPEDMVFGNCARAASQLAVLIILDATGRSEVKEFDPDAPRSERGFKMQQSTEDTYHLVSGNAKYSFSAGEFPEYDAAKRLSGRSRDDIPPEELPLEAIMERVEQALAYSVE